MLVSSHTKTKCRVLKILAPLQSQIKLYYRHLRSNIHKYMLENINFNNNLNKKKTNHEQNEFIDI